jgi:hypothetical protein
VKKRNKRKENELTWVRKRGSGKDEEKNPSTNSILPLAPGLLHDL